MEDASKRTFNEVKSNLPEYNEAGLVIYGNEPIFNEHSFLEVDEEEQYEAPVYKNNYSASDSKVRYDEDDRNSRSRAPNKPSVRSAESFLNDGLPEYIHPDDSTLLVSGQRVVAPTNGGGVVGRREQRMLRRPSNETIENEDSAGKTVNEEEHHKRKPEQMRSISEDVPARVFKAVTRRSLSHPEKDTQVISII